MGNEQDREIRTYCSQCINHHPVVCTIKDGKFVQARPDTEHPFHGSLCPKGLAGPEMVYNPHRLQYPMRRTRPKGDPDPGWERISWDEALDTIAEKLKAVKTTYGAESVAMSQTFGGSAMLELLPFVRRLANAFGTPNNVSTTYICNWHHDFGSGYTFGTPPMPFTAGSPDFEHAGCILVWGNNTAETNSCLMPRIERGLKNGAKLIVIDPRKRGLAKRADLWMRVKPGADGALALGMIWKMLEDESFESDFVRDWTTAPFLVRKDTGNLIRAQEVWPDAEESGFVVINASTNKAEVCLPRQGQAFTPVLDSEGVLSLAEGNEVEYTTVFQLLRNAVSEYPLSKVERITGVPEAQIREAVELMTNAKPLCWHAWNGIQQTINATHTNRAICILYALTGDYDKPGGNLVLPFVPFNFLQAFGPNLLSLEAQSKCLGLSEFPLGAQGTYLAVPPYIFHRTVLSEEPYPIKALLSFGGNLLPCNPPSTLARDAHMKLDFHAHVDLFHNPTSELADIVLPAASCWESWHVGSHHAPPGETAVLQLRPAIVPPQHESRPDMDIIFDLAQRLDLGDKFWGGDIETGFNDMLAMSGLNVDRLRQRPGGIPVRLPVEYQKYEKKDASGKYRGFPTPSGRMEIYQQKFKNMGQDPLPVWNDPYARLIPDERKAEDYPLILTNAKLNEFCHSQHRSFPSLRKKVPEPFLEMNPETARGIGCEEGEWVVLETPQASITLKLSLNEDMASEVVCTQHGWWEACPELGLKGYDVYSSDGANVNLLYSLDHADPISGCLPLKGYPCSVRKKG